MCLTNLSVDVTQSRNTLNVVAQGRVGNNAKQLVLRRRRRGNTLTLTVTTAAMPDVCDKDVRCMHTNVELDTQLDLPTGVRRVRIKNPNGQLLEVLDIS